MKQYYALYVFLYSYKVGIGYQRIDASLGLNELTANMILSNCKFAWILPVFITSQRFPETPLTWFISDEHMD